MRGTIHIGSVRVHRLAGASLVFACICILSGCLGVSSGGSSSLSLSSSAMDFGSVGTSSRKTLIVWVTNSGTASITISSMAVSSKAFSFVAPSLPATIAAGQSTIVSVRFAPGATGAFSDTLAITSDASNPLTDIPLSGTGTAVNQGQLEVSPASLGLGNVVVGTSGTTSGSLTASGGSVTVTAATTDNSEFSIGGLSLPVTIPAGQSVPFNVTFSPQNTGATSAKLTVTSNAQSSTEVEGLAGTGTAAPTHAVNLAWNASTSPNIVGYNVYRAAFAGSCGSFAKINSVLDTGTLYSDATVADGAAYCYGTSAVDTGHHESNYSNIVFNVQIPAP